MELINLTPHKIKEVETGAVFPVSGLVARVDFETRKAGNIGDIALYKRAYGQPVGIPKSQAGVIYIVSNMVLNALNGSRKDVVAPGELIRNSEGNPTGCIGFVC